jgi:RNA polymerase primary sigma factor
MSKFFVNYGADGTINKYFKDVKKSDLLTLEKEIELAIKIQNGDKKAVDLLVESNLKFVVSIAKEYQNQGLSLSDLISEGNYGLIKAAYKFDHTKGFRFISYAVWWIRQSIIQSLNDNSRIIRLPTNVINKIYQLKQHIERFEFDNEREPVYGEVLNDDNDSVYFKIPASCSSLNDKINEDGDELHEIIQDSSSKSEDDFYDINSDVKKELDNTLKILDDREREIIECYFGINKEVEPMTLDAIGEKLSLSKERVRQIKNKAIQKLRHNSHNLYISLNK